MERGPLGAGFARTEPEESQPAQTQQPLEKLLVERRAKEKLFGLTYEPIRVGRYVLLGELGAGAMGIVHAAYDDTLDRKVALKFIHPERARSGPARERFLREARAMARVSHANVLQVYEAGEADDRVFIAIEFIEGTTLRAWLDRDPRPSVVDIIRTFCSAGEGLAAAHDAGVVHRDFKPDNVLVTQTGIPKVADFGVAGLELAETEPDPELRDLATTNSSLTGTGVAVGTPLYMSPEQHAGRRADPRSDQFAFCVALFEALYGIHPFGAESRYVLATNVIEGNVRELPSDHGVPAAVGRALLRGLSTDPDDRFTDMRDLLRVLAWDPGSRWARRGWWAAGGAVVLGGAGILWSQGQSGGPEPCTQLDARLAGVWDDARRAAVGAALTGPGAIPGAENRWNELRGRFDAYARRWLTVSVEGCKAHQSGELSAEAYDRQQWCLDKELLGLQATTESLLDVGTDRGGAGGLVPDLSALDRCTDVVRLTGGRATPATGPDRDRELEIRAELRRARAAVDLGRLDVARERLQTLSGRTDDDPDLGAEALLLEGRIAATEGDGPGSADRLTRSAALADEAGNDLLRARALIELVWTLGVQLYQADEASRVALQARGALERLGGHPALLAQLESGLGTTQMYAGQFDAAHEHLGRALSIAKEETLPELQVASVHTNLANVELRRGRTEAAVEHYEDARGLLERRDPDDPQLSPVLNNLGVALGQAGRHEDALATHRRSLRLRENLHGSAHIDVANALNGIAIALVELGRKEEALLHLERSLSIRQRAGGRQEDLAEARFALARACFGDDPDRARTEARAALEIYASPQLAAANRSEIERVSAWLDAHAAQDEGGEP